MIGYADAYMYIRFYARIQNCSNRHVRNILLAYAHTRHIYAHNLELAIMKHYDQLPPYQRPKSRPAPSMISKLETQSPRLMKLFRAMDEAKRKQADRKAHKMISFKRPLRGETRWRKSPVNAMERLKIHYREIGSPEPLSPNVLPPSSLLIPKQVRPPDPRSQSVFAVIYNDDDYVQVAPRPIKGLEIDSDITSDWSIPSSIESYTRKMDAKKANLNSLAYTYPPPSIKFLHKRSKSPRKLKFKRKTVAAKFFPRRTTQVKIKKKQNSKLDNDDDYLISTSVSHNLIQQNENSEMNYINNTKTTMLTKDDNIITTITANNNDGKSSFSDEIIKASNVVDEIEKEFRKNNVDENHNNSKVGNYSESNDEVNNGGNDDESVIDDEEKTNDSTVEEAQKLPSKEMAASEKKKGSLQRNENMKFFYDTRKFIYPTNIDFDLNAYKQLYLKEKKGTKPEAIPWKAYWKYSDTYRKVTLHKTDILTGRMVE
jgi:hypothetical protein